MPDYANTVTMIEYPLESAPVNVHGDFKRLAESLDAILPAYGVSYFHIEVLNDSGENLTAGTPVYATGFNGKTTIEKSTPSITNPILGLIKTDLNDGDEGLVVVAGVMDSINTSSFVNGDILYMGLTGGLTNVRPATGSGAVGIVAHAAVNGIIIVEAKGNGTWGALRDGLA
jgi:hypothetical protein